MISWGLVIAVCTLIAGFGSYANKYFINKKHRDRVRAALVALYALIERARISNFVLNLTRGLSGWAATASYFLISSMFFFTYGYLISHEIAQELSKGPLPPPFSDYFNQSLFNHPTQIIIFAWLNMSLCTFIVTWAVRQISNTLVLKKKTHIAPFVILVLYFLFLIFVEYASDDIDNWLLSAILHENRLLAAAVAILFNFIIVSDTIDDVWPIVLFTPIAIFVVTISGIIFFYLTRFIKWFSKELIHVASSPEHSPYTFSCATISLFVVFLKLLVEVRKLFM
jgi:hypothetical protein